MEEDNTAAHQSNADFDAKSLKGQFSVPEKKVYLAGNSLGLMPQGVPQDVASELAVWASEGVLGHTEIGHKHNTPWVTIDSDVKEPIARMVGAKPSEVVSMGTLTSNLHILMDAFYRPTPFRYKILYEEKAFPSDLYALQSQVKLHGFDPKTALVPVRPRRGEHTLRTEDIIDIIDDNSYQLSMVLFSGIQYYSGQYFDIPAITQAAHEAGAYAGFDLAHAIGNVPLELHEWKVDFAVWCSYKYLNSGPGGIAGIFVHEAQTDRPHLAGWFGHDLKTRFDMPTTFNPETGAEGYRLSNPSVLCVAALRSALKPFQAAYEQWKEETAAEENHFLLPLRRRSIELTGYLEQELMKSSYYQNLDDFQDHDTPLSFTIITPSNPEERGAQLSLLFWPEEKMVPVFEYLLSHGVVADDRKPGVIRFAPTPLYNLKSDCDAAVKTLNAALDEVSNK